MRRVLPGRHLLLSLLLFLPGQLLRWLRLLRILLRLVVVGIPELLAERGVRDFARVHDDVLFDCRFELGVLEVAPGGLESIREEESGFVLDLAGDEEAHDLHERDLDGAGVFENGELEAAGSTASVGVDLDAPLAPLLVKETIVAAMKRWAAAQSAVDLNVLATGNACGIQRHWKGSYPLPPAVLRNHGDRA